MKDTKFGLLDIIGRMNEKGIAVLYMIARKLILLKNTASEHNFNKSLLTNVCAGDIIKSEQRFTAR